MRKKMKEQLASIARDKSYEYKYKIIQINR